MGEEAIMESVQALRVGATYRAKRRGSPDRTVIWLGKMELQYDSAAVRFGVRYPRISIEKFLAWLGGDPQAALVSEEEQSRG